MRIKRIAVLGVSAVCILAMLVSIRGNSSTPVDQPSQEAPSLMTDAHQDPNLVNIIELHIDLSLDERSFNTLEALNENFMKQHPDIKVKLRNHTGDTLYDVLARAFRIGDPADIILLDNDQVLSYASKARLKPTDDFYTKETTAEYVPALTEQLKWNGYIWAIPYQVQPYVLSYHEQRWLEMTGNTLPVTAADVWHVWREGGLLLDADDPYTFAAFLESMIGPWQFARIDLPTQGTEETEETDKMEESEVAEEAGEPNESNEPNESSESNESSVASLTNNIEDDAREMSPVQAGIVQHSMVEKWTMLAEGEVAAMVVPLAEYAAYRSDAVAVTLLPNLEGDTMSLLTGRSFVLSAETKHEEAAYRWIQAMTNSFQEPDLDRVAGAYPANQAAYEDPTLRIQSIYRLLLSAIDKGQALAPDPNLNDKLSIIRDAMLTDASSDIWSEPSDLKALIVDKFAASGLEY